MRKFKSILIVPFVVPLLTACSLPLHSNDNKEEVIKEIIDINESIGVDYLDDDERVITEKGTIVGYKIVYDSAHQPYSSGHIEIHRRYFVVLKLDETGDRLVLSISEDNYMNTVVGDYVEVTHKIEDNICRKLLIIE